MLYDTFDVGKIKLGDGRYNLKGNDSVPVLYDGKPFVFSLKNKYIFVNGNDSYDETPGIVIRSKQYAEVVKQIYEASYCGCPSLTNDRFYARFGDFTKIMGTTEEELRYAYFDASISLTFRANKSSVLLVYVKDLILIKFVKDELEVELDKLELAS